MSSTIPTSSDGIKPIGFIPGDPFSGGPSIELNTTIPDNITLDDNYNLDNPSKVVSELIISSQLYKQAYDIFSRDVVYGTPYLNQLQMIPYSAVTRDENFWDSFVDFFGGTSGYESAVTDAFNVAMDEIRSLVQNYYSFINSLPETQIEQNARAGYNSVVTGQGIDKSSMDGAGSSGIVNPDNTPQSSYNNSQLSQGITSFVEFIGSMSNLVTGGFNIKNLMGLLDIAEREGYNKQELHDLLLSKEGVVTSSPYRVLTPDNTSVIGDQSSVASSQKAAAAKAVSGKIAVQVGDDPNKTASYEILDGVDVLTEISRFNLANQFADSAIMNLRNVGRQQFASALGLLEGEYMMTNYSALIAEGKFNTDFFSSRNGSLEGSSQSSLASSLSTIRQCEAYAAQFEQWMNEYRWNVLESWGAQLSQRPSLAPYFYKALFDFNMEDTFYHQNGAAMTLKYGLDSLQKIGSIISSFTGFKAPKRPIGRRTVTSGPNGTTISESIDILP